MFLPLKGFLLIITRVNEFRMLDLWRVTGGGGESCPHGRRQTSLADREIDLRFNWKVIIETQGLLDKIAI